MVITDVVCEEIYQHIAVHSPERGGALYGPQGYPFVTHFEFDPNAQTSAVSYVPSSNLIANVPRVERETGLQFKGIIHSHPRGIIRPSGGDEATVASFFRLNPHIASMALPIVQQASSRKDRFLHWYRAERRKTMPLSSPPWLGMAAPQREPVSIIAEEHHVLPLAEHVNEIVFHLKSKGLHLDVHNGVQSLKIQNASLIGLVASSIGGHEMMYFVSPDYPVVGPVVLYQRRGTTNHLQMQWDGLSSPLKSLHEIADLLSEEWMDSCEEISIKTVFTKPFN